MASQIKSYRDLDAWQVAMSLTQLIKGYEQQFGEIPVQGPRR